MFRKVNAATVTALMVLPLLMAPVGHANPITVTFSGVQTYAPSLFNGGPNALGIYAGQTVSGSFTVDTQGLAQTSATSGDPARAQIPLAVTEFTFESLEINAADIESSYYLIDATNNLLQFYANDVYDVSTSVVYSIGLFINPGVIGDDNFDLSTLKESDILGLGGIPFVDTGWGYQIAYNIGSPNFSQVQYSGYLTSVSVSSIPIPPAVWLFGSALGVMGVMRRKLTS